MMALWGLKQVKKQRAYGTVEDKTGLTSKDNRLDLAKIVLRIFAKSKKEICAKSKESLDTHN